MSDQRVQLAKIIAWFDRGGRSDDPLVVAIRSRSDPDLLALLDELLHSASDMPAEKVLAYVREQSLRTLIRMLSGPVADDALPRGDRLGWSGLRRSIHTEIHHTTRLRAVLYRAERALAEVPLSAPNQQLVRGIGPGDYCLRLDTGRVLWRADLTRNQVISRPSQEMGYRAAASAPDRSHGQGVLLFCSDVPTGAVSSSSRTSGENTPSIQLTLFRGFDSGTIELRSGGG